MSIRLERPEDYPAVLRLTYEAFKTLSFPGRRRMDEHYLIHLLKDTTYPIRELSFVYERDNPEDAVTEIVGHILYTKSKVVRPDESEIPTITFGPLSVLPKYHCQGIGKALVEHSMHKAREMGFGAVLITGIPDYYPKLSFCRGREYGIALPDGTSPDALMAYELKPGWLENGTLRFEAAEIFEKSEEDDEGFYEFHREFVKEYMPEIGCFSE